MTRPLVIWSVFVLLYAAFFAWYTNLRGPLTAAEVEHYMEIFATSRDTDPERAARMRGFLEEDTGDDFIMVNSILMREEPLPEQGVQPGESSSEVLGRYMAYMWPALIQRASHPVLAGASVAPSLEVWGIEGAERWTNAGMMRYRSRRDMLEIAATPAFNGPHQFKIAAIEKTFAYPIEAQLQLGDPRLILGLLFFSLAAALHLAVGRRRT